MLALDHRESFRKLLNPKNPSFVTEDAIIQMKSEIINSLYDQLSGILIDTEFGLPAYQGKSKPYLLPIEKSGYKDLNGDRLTELEFTATQLKEMGASGVKLLIYFNHDSSTVNAQMETVKKVLSDCKNNNLPLFLEIVTYNEKGTKSKQIITAVSMFLDQGIRPDVFKLEYPENEHSCDILTNYLGGTPWILLTRGIDYEAFKKQLETAASHGASGFLAGRSLWQEAARIEKQERRIFLKSVVVERFKEICIIIEGA